MTNVLEVTANPRHGHVRSTICAMLLLATSINYMDRQVIGLLKPTLQHRIGLTELNFGFSSLFLIAGSVYLLATIVLRTLAPNLRRVYRTTQRPRRVRAFTLAMAASLWASFAVAQDVHVRVSPDSKGTTASLTDFPRIQMALDHAPEPGPTGRLYLEIAPGIYHERVMVTQNRPRTTFQGTGSKPGDVVITASENAKSAGGTFFSSTAVISGDGFEADNITFENAAGNTGQAVALSVRSDKAIFKHCRFLGDQDTLFADFGRQYYVDSYIQGGVDFIFGNAAAVFSDDEIHIIRPGYLTAQSRTSPAQNTGYVFLHDRITAADMQGKTFYLGRPWRPYSRVVFLSSELPASLSPQGWSPWAKGGAIDTAFYAEHDDTGPGANPQDRLAGSHQLTAEEAAQFLPSHFLSGTDQWNVVAEAAKLP